MAGTTGFKSIRLISGLVLLGFAPLLLSAQNDPKTKPCMTCERIKELRLPDVTIVEARSIKLDTLQDAIITASSCRVLGRIGKEIEFELLLPQEWNERFVMSGGGGFVGSIQNSYRAAVNAGYATAGTDTGHKGDGTDASWALNNMERQINFGRLAIHLSAVVSKSIVNSYYCKDPADAYFLGCSRGGGQAMVEAQQYPSDFDGIVAGAPAFSWPAIGAKFIRIGQEMYPDPRNIKPVLTSDNLRLLQDLILRKCDALDGVSDSILNDPRSCQFDLSTLPVCPNKESKAGCFTAQQVKAIKTIYEPLMSNKEVVYPGFPLGGENEPGNWDIWIAGTNPGMNGPSLHYRFGTNMFKYLVYNDPEWDYTRYDVSTFSKDTRYASAFLDATNTDYSEFQKAGGKMILYHGWSDAALSAFQTIKHYEEVEKRDKGVQSYLRLFMLPGVGHCNGGPGPDQVDWLQLIRDWVEKDRAPTRVVMSKTVRGKTVMTRPVFPYPKMAVYRGKGNTNAEASFTAD